MKNISILFVLFITIPVVSQTNTEVYLFDLIKEKDIVKLHNKRNISSNVGYNNQPHIFNDTIVLFSSTLNNQTDIASYDPS